MVEKVLTRFSLLANVSSSAKVPISLYSCQCLITLYSDHCASFLRLPLILTIFPTKSQYLQIDHHCLWLSSYKELSMGDHDP